MLITLSIYGDVESGIEKRRFIHEGWVSSMSFSPDGQTLASGGTDGIRLWDVESGTKRGISDHTNWAVSLVFSPDGQTVASGGVAGTVRLWDIQSGIEKQILKGHTGNVRDLVFSPDGRMIASSDGTLLLWKLPQQFCHRILARMYD